MWATKTALIHELAGADELVMTDAQRREFGATQLPFEGTRVYLAHFPDVQLQVLGSRRVIKLHHDESAEVATELSTFGIGALILQVMIPSRAIVATRVHDVDKVVQIWPIINDTVKWPPERALSLSDLERFTLVPQ